MKWLLPLLVGLLVLCGWQATVTLFAVPEFIVPGPGAVWQAAVAHGAELGAATLTSAAAVVTGFAVSLVVGTFVAFVFAQWPLVARSLYPYAIFLQTVPLLAIAPLIVLWSGPGFRSVVIVTVIASIFPIITSAAVGFSTVDRELVELFTLYEASRWRTFWSLRLPHAVPHLVAGAQAAGGLAVIGAIAGEVFAGAGVASHGLGYLITLTAAQLRTADLFAAVLASTALGLGVFGLLAIVGHHMTRRWHATAVEG